MPLYEYECETCEHRFEVIHQRFSDPPITICPKCGGPVRKLMSSPAIQFKGSGFYITDYARGGKSEGSADTSDASSSSESKHESKGESKTESKGDAKTESKGDTKTESKRDSRTESKGDTKAGSKGETKSESKGESKSSGSGSTPSTS